MSYKFLEHTGDTAVEIHAADEVELFRDGERALLDILVDQEHGKPVEKKKTLPLRLEAEDAESLVRAADEALMRAKEEGKNRIRFA